MNPTDRLLIDFRELSSGEEFECFAQDLFEELGYRCLRTGRGTDSGVDLVIERMIEDPIAGPIRRRYIVQCKHLASSRRTVSVADLGPRGILDLVTSFGADGYILVCSTGVSSALHQHFGQLRRTSAKEVLYWDRAALSKQLQLLPRLAVRHFASALSRYRPIKPATKRGLACYDRIISHQIAYVGVKFIPELYVVRELEGDLFDTLLPHPEHLERARAAALVGLEKFCGAILSFTPSWQFVRSPLAPRTEVYQCRFDFQSARDTLTRTLRPLRELDLDFAKAYHLGGLATLAAIQDAAHKAICAARDTIFSVLAPLRAAVEAVRLQEKDLLERRHVYYRLKALDAEHPESTRPPGFFTSTERKLLADDPPLWRPPRFARSSVFMFAKAYDAAQVTPASILAESLERFVGALNADPFAEAALHIARSVAAIQVIVDVAGSGKTNLACRLAFQLSHYAFAVFLTGRSYGKEFEAIDTYLNGLIIESFPGRQGRTLEDNCRWLLAKAFPLVVILDGVNEAPNIEHINREILKLIHLSSVAPVRLLITARSEYWSLFESILRSRPDIIVREGKLSRFSEAEYQTVIAIYLSHYRLSVRLEGRAWQSLRRPLLLRFFCEAYGKPGAAEVRRLPPIREVHLTALFREYCALKFANIDRRLRGSRTGDAGLGAESALLALASRLLRTQRSSMAVSEVRRRSLFGGAAGDLAYRALLDEDIILEEFSDPVVESRRQARVGFVYEAFMEYLMARVLMHQSRGRDVTLAARLRKLLREADKFQNVRGILTFLAPEAAGRHPRTFVVICDALRNESARDLCLPTLVNMWESSWRQGVLPLLKVIDAHWPAIAVDDIREFLTEWLPDHGGEAFLVSVKHDPAFAIRLLGDEVADVVGAISDRERAGIGLEAALRVLEVSQDPTLSQKTLKKAIEVIPESMTRNARERGVWGKVLAACLPLLSTICQRKRWERDWGLLWDLGRLVAGEDWKGVGLKAVDKEKLSPIVKVAVIDYYRGHARGLDSEVDWWIRAMNWTVEKIRRDAWVQSESDDLLEGTGWEFRRYFSYSSSDTEVIDDSQNQD